MHTLLAIHTEQPLMSSRHVWQENTEPLKEQPGLLKQFANFLFGRASEWKSCFSGCTLTLPVCVCVFPSKLPQTQMEWAQLLESQQRFHDAELQKWREIIKSSVVLLDQVLNRRNSPNLTEVDGNVLKINWRTVHFRFSYANNWWLYNSSIPAVSRGPVPGCMKFQTWIFTGVNYKFKIWA